MIEKQHFFFFFKCFTRGNPLWFCHSWEAETHPSKGWDPLSFTPAIPILFFGPEPALAAGQAALHDAGGAGVEAERAPWGRRGPAVLGIPGVPESLALGSAGIRANPALGRAGIPQDHALSLAGLVRPQFQHLEGAGLQSCHRELLGELPQVLRARFGATKLLLGQRGGGRGVRGTQLHGHDGFLQRELHHAHPGRVQGEGFLS